MPRRPPPPGSTGRPARPAAPSSAGRATTPRGPARSPRAGSSRPAGTRPKPGSAGRAGAAGATLRAGAGRPLWVLGGVAVLLAVLILPYVQKWLVQRSDIAAARADVADQQRRVRALEAEKKRWQDPAYVTAQARERLHFVMPGETGYVVVDGTPRAVPPSDPGARAARVPDDTRPWFGDLWQSVKVAGDRP